MGSDVAMHLARRFNEVGYVHIPSAIPADLISGLERAVDRIHEDHLSRQLDPCRATPLTRFTDFHCSDVFWRDPIFVELVDIETILGLVTSILGWNIYSFHSHLNVTPPIHEGCGSLPWHQDGKRVNQDLGSPPHARLSLKVAYWLTDVTKPDRGNLHVIPSSHVSLERYYRDDCTAGVPILAAPGDATVFDRRLWHARGHNVSQITRKAVFIGYGFRWLRPREFMNIPPQLLANSKPVRRQLLGASTQPAGYYSPEDDDCPVKTWMSDRCLSVIE